MSWRPGRTSPSCCCSRAWVLAAVPALTAALTWVEQKLPQEQRHDSGVDLSELVSVSKFRLADAEYQRIRAGLGAEAATIANNLAEK